MSNIRKPYLWEALVPILGMSVIVIVGMLVLGLDPHIPIVLACVLASIMAARLGLSWSDIQAGMLDSIFRVVAALIIIMTVGMLIGTWMLAGIIPALIYYGLDLIAPSVFLLTGCVLCALASIATGSSWTASGTVGIALMGIAAGLGVNPALAAGMVVSGAYFGDKLSPLSDSTNIAAAAGEVNLYDHVRSMMYTTIPSFIIALIIYGIIGAQFAGRSYDPTTVDLIQSNLLAQFNLSPWLFLPPLFIIFAAIKKIPPIPSLLASAIIGGIFAMIFQGVSIAGVLEALHYGYASDTGISAVDRLLTRGGLDYMMWTISLIIFALAFGGILEKARFLEVLVEKVIVRIKTVGALVAATIFTGILGDIVLTDQYLSIIVPGRLYAPLYDKMNLERRVLSRSLEDGATLWSPMFPWNGCGAYQAATLGVATFAYFPYAFFNLVTPIVAIAMAYMGIAAFKKQDTEADKAEGGLA